MQWISAAEFAVSPLLHDPRTLGIAIFSGAAAPAGVEHLPRAHLRTSVIGADSQMIEAWSGSNSARDETIGRVHCRHNGDVLFAAVSVAIENSEGDGGPEAATYIAYRSLLDALQTTGYSCPLRIWNSIPDINVEDAGLERYRRFNMGRYKAYEESALPTHQGAPAACALGSHGGPLVLYCLAAKSAAVSIENPRQVSAYRYPQRYGPRAPNFSRAALWRGEKHQTDVLFVSGTASIVGHQTLHIGDVHAQTRETLANLQSLLAEAMQSGAAGVASLSDLLFKIYVRYPADAPLVHQALREHGLDSAATLTLRADVCRSELLMEIEAIGPTQAITTETTDMQDCSSRPKSDSQALQETG